MLSSISTLQSLAKYNTNKLVTVFDPTNWDVTNSFSMVRMTWDADSNVASSVGKILNITVTRNGGTITTRFYAYVRCGTSTTNILTTYTNVTNASNISVAFTSTSSVLLNQLTECIITGLSYNTSYNITLEFDTNGSSTISKSFTIQTYTYGSGAVPASLFKMLPWKRSTPTYYKANTSTSDYPTSWYFPTTYADTANKGFWIMREGSALLTQTARTQGGVPDQTTRAINNISLADSGALMWGMQSTAVAKTTAAYNFQANSTYVLSCMVVGRNLETVADSIDVYIDPSATTNYTGAIKIGTISMPIFTATNWTYTSFTYNTGSSFTTGNYYIRLLGTLTTDNSIIVSNCDLVKTA